MKTRIYWDSDYRVISEIILVNKSSEPISIIEFTLNDKYHFNSYSKPGGYYTIIILPDKILSKMVYCLD
jgi:hypothetical protein